MEPWTVDEIRAYFQVALTEAVESGQYPPVCGGLIRPPRFDTETLSAVSAVAFAFPNASADLIERARTELERQLDGTHAADQQARIRRLLTEYTNPTKGDRMYGVWQSGELFWKGQQPWFVSESLSKLEDWATVNIEHDGQKPFYFVESVGAGKHWSDENLTCLGQLRKDGIKNNASQAQLEGHVARRRREIEKCCLMLTEDERARRTVNIDTETTVPQWN
jgi:hypothetical protein